MTQPLVAGATRADAPAPDPSDASTGEPTSALPEHLGALVPDEVRLVQAEITESSR